MMWMTTSRGSEVFQLESSWCGHQLWGCAFQEEATFLYPSCPSFGTNKVHKNRHFTKSLQQTVYSSIQPSFFSPCVCFVRTTPKQNYFVHTMPNPTYFLRRGIAMSSLIFVEANVDNNAFQRTILCCLQVEKQSIGTLCHLTCSAIYTKSTKRKVLIEGKVLC